MGCYSQLYCFLLNENRLLRDWACTPPAFAQTKFKAQASAVGEMSMGVEGRHMIFLFGCLLCFFQYTMGNEHSLTHHSEALQALGQVSFLASSPTSTHGYHSTQFLAPKRAWHLLNSHGSRPFHSTQ